MPTPTRRDFLAASAVTLTAASYTRAAQSPNESVKLAVMGLKIRGKQLIPGFAALKGVVISHVVDPDPAMVGPALAGIKNSASPPAVETDIRKVLDDKSVTAVVVSAPDHWHRVQQGARKGNVAEPDARVRVSRQGACEQLPRR